MLQHRSNSVLNTRPLKPAARSRLIIGDFGPSDSARAAARGWRLRRPAAERHAARCASRDLCSGGALRRYPPSDDRIQPILEPTRLGNLRVADGRRPFTRDL